jgi:hypothetical protein
LIARGNRGGARSGEANEGKGARKEGEGGADKWARSISDTEKKEKGGEEVGRCGDGEMGQWPAGLEREVRSFSIFFLFPFSNSFKIQTFSTQIHSKLFKLFHKIV